jgi:plasmid stabilization system protein ParE
MRRIVFAPSFDQEVEDIGIYIEERFGEAARRLFVAELADLCTTIASVPGIGTTHHGYDTSSVGFVFRQNWVFFQYDEEHVHFLHIVDGRRHKPRIGF